MGTVFILLALALVGMLAARSGLFHLLAYTAATGGSVTDADMTAATDPEISQRNSHYILTEPYNLIQAAVFAAHATRANIQSPTLNAVTRPNIWPVNESAAIPSPPNMDNYDYMQIPIPMNEELQVKMTDGTSEQFTTFLWIATADWTRNIPRGITPVPMFECRVTASPTGVANAWSTLAALTFEQSLRGGTYAVVGAAWQGTNLMAVRLVFPRQKMYNGRKLRPGVLASAAIGDLPSPKLDPYGPLWYGEHGRFSTFELPQIEVWANASGAITTEGRLWLVRLSEDMNVVY